MFYSNMLFEGLSMTNTEVTFLIGIVNFITSIFGLVLLIWFGRRSLMLFFNIAMTITLLLLAYYSFENFSAGMIVSVLLFNAFFACSSGPILWLYSAEILHDKAISIASFIGWISCLVISISVPELLQFYEIGVIFRSFAIFTLLGIVFIYKFMKETRGLTQAEIRDLFNDT